MILDKTETIERLCQLVSTVGDKVFHNHVLSDCFCGISSLSTARAVVDSEIIEWIEEKMEAAIEVRRV